MEIDLRLEIVIQELQAWMDGGSVTLICSNKGNQKFRIEFIQNVVWEIPKDSKLPGRIYLDDKLINIRSDSEDLIIKNLENTGFAKLDKLDWNILNDKIEYVKSEQFLDDINRVEIVNIDA